VSPAVESGDEKIVKSAADVSLVLGSMLLVIPSTAGRALGVETAQRTLRTIGIVDIALALGSYFGRPKWPWLVARAASNPFIATIALANARSVRARLMAAGLIGAAVMDLRAAVRMRSARPDSSGSTGH
jgi:hypothetical protein